MQSRPASGSFAPETVSQAGAGALLLAVAVVELSLEFWAAGWWHRGAALLVALVGAALVARAVGTVVPRLRPQLPRYVASRASGAPLPVPSWAGLAEWAQR